MRGKPTPRDVSAYLAREPAKVRKVLQQLRATIRTAAPEAEESIGYGMPYYKQDGPLVAFAAFKNHCSLFGMSSQLNEQFKKELAVYEISKGTIRFTVERPLPKALVTKLVKARVAMNRERQKARTAKRKRSS